MQGEKPIVIFILGGPGSGKGTQSALIQEHLGFVHLSAGDLLRAQRKKEGSKNGALIEDCIVHGKIVPSYITVALLEQAMRENGWTKSRFLVDGFPRNEQNFSQWNKLMGEKVETPFLVFLDCSEEVMLERLTKRSQTSGRSDDNIESIKKRFHTYENETRPVINYFDEQKKCVHMNAVGDVKVIFEILKAKFFDRGIKAPEKA